MDQIYSCKVEAIFEGYFFIDFIVPGPEVIDSTETLANKVI